ncbi:fluoride efflux transporter FluC [Humidisolicoccus flavus]|uniref:fluoride efflux transporter FluC n=1 Tax=Humidisolicoccus flavus TaxID=3111414 RepID=UPI00324CC4D0
MGPHFAQRSASTVVAELGIVALGGALGTAARLALSVLLPDDNGITIGVLLANIVGSFALGWLVTRFTARPLPAPKQRRRHLFAAVGVLGSFTTYSAVALEASRLSSEATTVALAYAFGSVALGVAAAWLGIRLAGLRSLGSKVDRA